MSLTIKAFLYQNNWRGDPVEIRRFTVDQDVTTSYAYLVQKIAQVFPSLLADHITIAWIDNDGDYILISSDEELVDALDQFDGSVFRLYLKKHDAITAPSMFAFSGPPREQPATLESDNEEGEEGEGEGQPQEHSGGDSRQEQPQQQQQQQGTFHPGVVCDGCNGPIYGTRYKCLVCGDYDLCSSCESKGTHVQHNMVAITDPHSYNPWGFPFPFARGGWRGRGRPGCGRGQPGCGRWGRHWAAHGRPHCRPHQHHHQHAPHQHHHQHAPHQHPYFWGGAGPWDLGGWWRQWAGPHTQEGDQPKPPGTQEPMDTEQQQKQGVSGEEQAKLYEEQRKSYLQGIGEAVSSFLAPFGVKVDVDVVGEETPKPDAKQQEEDAATSTTTDQRSEPTVPPEVPSGATINTAYPQVYPTLDPASPPQTSGASPWSDGGPSAPPEQDTIQQVVAQLRGMGFDDDGGWLTELVKAKGGDIGKVLDALHPSN